MNEIFEARGRVVPTVIELPPYSDPALNRLARLAPDYDVEDNKVVGNSGEKLGLVRDWWQKRGQVQKELSRLRSASTLPGLPHLESKQASQCYEDVQEFSNKVVRSLGLTLVSQKPTWNDVGEVVASIHAYTKKIHLNDQIVAVCEAIDETRNLGLSDSVIRQKVAQYAWDELIQLVPYAKLDDHVRTTQDDLETEKIELLEVMNHPLWDADNLKRRETEYNKFKDQMRVDKYDPALRKVFKALYEAATGKIPSKMSAIDILRKQEEILVGLYNENAFDTD